jgi:two-component system, OmpR family, osmolarity sensor histidine kinase EnvZ
MPHKSITSLFSRLRFDLAFFRMIKRVLPRGLYGRALLILVVPVILSQALAIYVFYERHWQTVANRLAFALAGEIAVISERMNEEDPQAVIDRVRESVDKNLYLTLKFIPGKTIKDFPMRGDYSTILSKMLLKALNEKIGYRFALDLRYAQETISIYVQLNDGVLSIVFPERRVYTPTTTFFVVWMIGTSLLLSVIAILFLRNQIRPITRLAIAAEKMGKGEETPEFRPEGATEIRQAAINLMIMRDRLRRQVAQRTAMLNGVSHDLRTPLTRMKLQLELMPTSTELDELKTDVEEMSLMIEAYLSFARGEETEETTPVLLEQLLADVVTSARRSNVEIHLDTPDEATVFIRATAIKRALNNLIGNAARYGKEVWIETEIGKKFVNIMIDDNGPGIPKGQREDVFKPFTRLETSRNPETGGVGLGLTIARDIAHRHGGDVMLDDSPHGGLRAILRLPL